MMVNFSEFKGIDPNYVTKLREAKVDKVEDFLNVWNDTTKRADLMKRTGITETQFTPIVSMARLSRVKGMTPEYVRLLVNAGVEGPKKLSSFTPELLVKLLRETAVKHEIAVPNLTPNVVEAWFADVKTENVGRK